MKYAPRHIANALLWKAKREGASLTHMKLQKLVFFVHAWGLALKNRPVASEGFEAWNYGPVVNSLYHELKNFGSKPVTSYLVEVDPASGATSARVPSQKDSEFWDLIDQVWDRYGHMSAAQLSTLSHEPGGPWARTRALMEEDGAVFDEIPDESIRNFYAAKLAKPA